MVCYMSGITVYKRQLGLENVIYVRVQETVWSVKYKLCQGKLDSVEFGLVNAMCDRQQETLSFGKCKLFHPTGDSVVWYI